MTTRDPNLDSVELVARALGELRRELVLVGGCAVGLLITDKARPSIRETKDVDLIAEVVSMPAYYLLEQRLVALGFSNNIQDEVICRWYKDELLIDVMPTAEIGFGSTNEWYPMVVQYAERRKLPSGLELILCLQLCSWPRSCLHFTGAGMATMVITTWETLSTWSMVGWN
ncbi:MAG: hypothetical protein M3Y65_12615 [Pseudomonadota bacterium]|nr:hypothetical protein [Pseudomonadota bacterium]